LSGVRCYEWKGVAPEQKGVVPTGHIVALQQRLAAWP
jgi:hypothetical protein